MDYQSGALHGQKPKTVIDVKLTNFYKQILKFWRSSIIATIVNNNKMLQFLTIMQFFR